MLTRYVLNGIIIEELPDGWNDRITNINNDRALKSRLVTEDATLTWYADGYQYIKSVFDNNIVGEISLKIQNDALHNGTWVTDYIGILKMPGCEFNVAPNYVRTKIEDDGFYARINNNKSLKTTVNNERSKNDLAITPADNFILSAASLAAVGCAHDVGNIVCYSIDECFRYMIDFMGDGDVGYISETFDDSYPATGEYGNFVLVRGVELRLGATNTDLFLEMDFKTLYSEVDKKFNIGFRMERINGKPTIRIEKESWFIKNSSYVQINGIRNIKRTVDAEFLYSAINAGSTILDDTPSLGFPEKTRWKSFNDEQYYVIGTSNIDRVLDLKSDWIISSNVIMDVISNNADDYDDDVFMIEIVDTDGPGVVAHQTGFLGIAACYFNEHLNNEHVTTRWLDGIPEIIAAQLGYGGDSRFLAARYFVSPDYIAYSNAPAVSIVDEPLQFEDDYTAPTLFDPSNSYGNGTAQGSPVSQANSRYTASAPGVYHFQSRYYFSILEQTARMQLNVYLSFKVYNAANVLQQTFTVVNSYTNVITAGFPYDDQIFNSAVIPIANANDYVVVRREFTTAYLGGGGLNLGYFVKWKERQGSAYGCMYSSLDEGGEFTTTQIVNQRYMKYAAKDVPITEDQVAEIIADTAQPIWMNVDGNNNYKGWIDKIKFNRSKGTADITTLGRRIDEPQNP